MVAGVGSVWSRWGNAKALAIFRMSRPLLLLAAVMANFAGLAMAYHVEGAVDLGIAALSMVILLLATAMGHFLDEYADVDTDTLTRRTLISGGSGVLPSGETSPGWALLGSAIGGLGSVLFTVIGFLQGLLSVGYLAMVFLAIVLAYCYSMPPLRLERRGWGELDNAFLGTLMFFSGYLPQIGALSSTAVIAAVPVFLTIMVNLIGVHWADREADEVVGKRTLIVRLDNRSMLLFPVLLMLIYSIVLFFNQVFPLELLAAYALTIPFALWAYREFRRTKSPYPGSIFMVVVLLANIIGWSI